MTIYYVRPTNGLDTNAGTSFAAAFQTTQKAADTAIGGDEVRLCNEATETPSATVDFDLNAGSVSAPILFIAADSIDGTPLTTGFYTISGSSLPATTDLLYLPLNNIYIELNKVRVTAATRDGITFGTNNHFLTLRDCRVDTHASDGIYITNTGAELRFYNTEIDSNTGQGIAVNAAGRGNIKIFGGSIHDNTSIGAEIGGDAGIVNIFNVEIYGNGSDGLRLIGGSGSAGGTGAVESCTVYGNTGSGIYIDGGLATLINNTSSSNGGYGFNITTNGDDSLLADYNHTYNNTSGASNITLPGDNNQTGNPNFASVTGGSEDFTPDNGSPLDSNGINGKDIGARKATDPAGGGGGAIVNQGIHAIDSGIMA